MAKKGSKVPENKIKTPKKLAPPSKIKSPSILDVSEGDKSIPDEPIIVVDVPLYPTDTNEYLDENGQVVFNFYKLVQDKFGWKATTQNKAKRSLLGDLTAGIGGGNSGGAGGAEDDDDVIVVEDDDGEDEEEEDDDDEEDANTEKKTASPKKKPHPMKGKSRIGKYDIEDPFIDDSELLWEEQRAATKDGFFVYFGPLIERGQYASLERADGTMKRGGVKNPK